ncbi:MAG TPA: NAD-dependent epimerase/dehydratase family protein, partial [Clostridiales bacterium]|nr:NAD-dependent epimerase/dehydratase family protein [Clostridiales bacterium]
MLRDSAKNREMFSDYLNDSSVKIVWGDLCDFDSVLKCVTGADIVLHVGGLVSPAADYFPLKTQEVNVKAMQNIVDAVKAQPDPDSIKVVYIGTVAQ